MGFVIFLPLPLGNLLPSLSLMLLCLGWMARDGAALALSVVMGAAGIGYAALLWQIALLALQNGWNLLTSGLVA